MTPVRRTLLKGGLGLATCVASPIHLLAQTASPAPQHSRFHPQPDGWRTFEVTTRVELSDPVGRSRIWLPMPSIESDWQRSLDHSFSTNGQARIASDGVDGARLLWVEFDDGIDPVVELTSRIQTRNRALSVKPSGAWLDAGSRQHFTRATSLLPTDGIVRQTAQGITRGVQGDMAQAKAIYEWVVGNAWREPTVRGCGEGDIRTMLETGNLGGKCADINALFVGLCRSVGLPARDVYGIRLAPSAFGYKELSANPSQLKGAQHCRAEVFLVGWGWVAVDPADVAKVMRQETAQWIRSTQDPLIKPVHEHLFGGWEGNWMGFNTAHDVQLPQAETGDVHFLMYPIAETEEGRVDSYSPDAFSYRIASREIKA
jgi:transglutaminase-like putative cysteine protease